MTQFLRTGFRRFAVKMTGINAAVSYNLQNALTGVYPGYAIDYAKALVTRGNLALALNQAATAGAAGTVVFTCV
jgi:hypothetical protein